MTEAIQTFGSLTILTMWELISGEIFQKPCFSCYFSKRWRELTEIEGPLHIESLENTLDSLVTITNEARVRENQKWGNLGQYNSHIQEIKIGHHGASLG